MDNGHETPRRPQGQRFRASTVRVDKVSRRKKKPRPPTPPPPSKGPAPPTATEGHTSILPRRPKPHGPTLHPSLPLVLSSVLRVVSLPLVVPTLPQSIVRRYGDVG